MKQQTTMKNIKALYKNIIQVGYGDIQNLTSRLNATYYTCGVYGWNSDIYIIDSNTVISTGYRPFGNMLADRNTLEKYEKLGKNATTTEQQENLLEEFATEIINKYKSK